MDIRKRLRDFRSWCPQPPNPLPTKLKRYSAPIAVVLSVTLFLVSFSVFFSSYVFHPSMPQVPLPVVNVLSSTSTEPPASNWAVKFGTGLSDSASKVIQTSDGGYAVIGTLGNGYAPSTAMLVKTDSSGKMLWNQTYNYLNSGIAVVQTSDGGYTIAGNGNGGFMLVKTDSRGNAVWNQTYTVSYQGNKGGDALTMTQTNDGGYVIAGACTPYLLGQGSNNAFVVKTDSSGKMQWSKTYGGSGIDFFRSAVQISNGDYVLAGCTTSFGAGGFDAWLVEVNSSGNQLWSKTFGAGPTSNPTQPQTGTVGDDEANSVVQTSDGGFALAGYTYSFGLVGSKNAWLIKTDASGTIQWNKTYGGQEQSTANSLIETSDGGLAFAGATLVNTNWGLIDNMWLVKTDSVGNGQWNQTFGGMTTTPDIDIANSLIQTSDGSFVLAGSTNPGSTSHGGYYYVVKTMSVVPSPLPTPQTAGNAVINSDGSVTGTNAIEQIGSTYVLTGNISNGIDVQKSGIVIDGAGYTLDKGGIDLTNGIGQDPTRSTISNVTIENLHIVNCGNGVTANGGGNDTFYNDYISNCTGDACIMLIGDCDYNNITFCTLNGSNGTEAIGMVYGANYNGTITENNIMGGVMVWLSEGGTVDRNYWGDYLTRYPNAKEVGSSGIGNTPYVFSTAQNGSETIYYQDNHPLMKPVSITISEFPSWTVLPLLIIIVIGGGLLLYFKKRNH